jgi:two-component system, sensor histidine kinase LadS
VLVLKDLEQANLEKERETERKKLIEQQKFELERIVSQRTIDLQNKTMDLQNAFEKIQESEQKLRELNHLKDRFFSIISHDLRSPLATLHSFLNLLSNFSGKISEDDQKILTHKTQDSLKNLSALLDNLLTWATNQMGKSNFCPEVFDLQEIVEENVQLLQSSAEIKKIKIQTKNQEYLFVKADKNMISFIVRNLILNAIKFTHENGNILIKTVKNEDSMYLEVCDDGKGISEENIQKIFSLEESLTTKGTFNEKGIGLGLLLCQEFLHKHHTALQIYSQLNIGSRFGFELPLAQEISKIP